MSDDPYASISTAADDPYASISTVEDDPYASISAVGNQNTWDESVMARGSALLSGLTFGYGEEAAAAMQVGGETLANLLTGNFKGDINTIADRYAYELERRNKAVQQERETSGGTMTALELAGMIPSSIKLGAALGVGSGATRLRNMEQLAGQAGLESLIYQTGNAEGDMLDRLAAIDPGETMLASGIGGAFGSLLRGTDTIGKASEPGWLAKKLERYRDDIYTSTKRIVGDDVSAREMVEADGLKMRTAQALHEDPRLAPKALDNLHQAFNDSPQAAKLVSDANAVINGSKAPMAMRAKALDAVESVLRRSNPEAADSYVAMRAAVGDLTKELRVAFPKAAQELEDNYMGIIFRNLDEAEGVRYGKATAKSGSTRNRTTGYVTQDQAMNALHNPVYTFMRFFDDANEALSLAKAYGVTADTTKFGEKGVSLRGEVIKAIVKKKAPTLGQERADRLGDALATMTIDGSMGMNPLFGALRMGMHAALLGTPENAVLQVGDLGSAAYATTFRDAVKSLPKSLASMILTDGDVVVNSGLRGRLFQGTIRAPDLGVSRQHLTEIMQESANDLPPLWRRLQQANRTVSETVMGASGVRKMNRLGLETLANAEVSQMSRLAKQGRDALAKSKYAEGLTPQKLDQLYNDLLAGNVKADSVLDSTFFGLSRIQPIGRNAVPAKYLEMKNGRLLYSMKMYMVKMASRINEDVFKKAAEAERAGLQTEKGRKLMGEALKNTARYGTYIVALNALVDPGRKEVFRGKESPNTFGEELVRQGVGFASGGMIDTNAGLYGRSSAEALLPPVATGVGNMADLAQKMLSEDEVTEADLRRMGQYIPGIRQLLWMQDVEEAN